MRLLWLASIVLAACSSGPSVNPSSDTSAPVTIVDDAGVATLSVAPTLKPGVDPAIFLPHFVEGYHPTAEELATSGKPCSTDADCDITDGQVIFHCSLPYYGQAQCQGSFPPGDQVVPGVVPSCAYYDCPAAFECEDEAESHSVACIQDQSHHHGGR